MHCIIILAFGPTGLNFNLIILPWNLAMTGIAVVLLYDSELVEYKWNFFRKKLNLVTLIVVGTLPILSFFKSWDNYLSFNLYSGNTPILIMCGNQPNSTPELQQFQSKNINKRFCKEEYVISTHAWAIKELNVPVVPEERVYKKIKIELEKKYPSLQLSYVYYQYPYKDENIKKIQ